MSYTSYSVHSGNNPRRQEAGSVFHINQKLRKVELAGEGQSKMRSGCVLHEHGTPSVPKSVTDLCDLAQHLA